MKAEHIKEFQALDMELAELRRHLVVIDDAGSKVHIIGAQITTRGAGDYGATVNETRGCEIRDTALTATVKTIVKAVLGERISAIQKRQKELDK